MCAEQQEQLSTPLFSKGSSLMQRSQDSLNDVTNVFTKVAKSYDSEYADLCTVLEDVADDVEEIKNYRMNNITSLRDEIEKLINATEAARKSATDTRTLEKHRQQVQKLEREKQQLVKDIVEGKGEEKMLREKLQRVEQQMEVVRVEHESVMEQTRSELPSLEYLKKVLQRLSHTYLAKGDSRVTEGFVCKNGSNDVRPFRFDESISQYDQVNQLWKMISEE